MFEHMGIAKRIDVVTSGVFKFFYTEEDDGLFVGHGVRGSSWYSSVL